METPEIEDQLRPRIAGCERIEDLALHLCEPGQERLEDSFGGELAHRIDDRARQGDAGSSKLPVARSRLMASNVRGEQRGIDASRFEQRAHDPGVGELDPHLANREAVRGEGRHEVKPRVEVRKKLGPLEALVADVAPCAHQREETKVWRVAGDVERLEPQDALARREPHHRVSLLAPAPRALEPLADGRIAGGLRLADRRQDVVRIDPGRRGRSERNER